MYIYLPMYPVLIATKDGYLHLYILMGAVIVIINIIIILTSRDAKIQSRGFLTLGSREVNMTFQRLLWNDLNQSLRKLKA
jgi:hypothetical protein